jgi:hypothetical protein
VAHTKKKLDGALKTLEQTWKADEAHRKLEDKLNIVMEKKRKFEDEIATDSRTEIRSRFAGQWNQQKKSARGNLQKVQQWNRGSEWSIFGRANKPWKTKKR